MIICSLSMIIYLLKEVDDLFFYIGSLYSETATQASNAISLQRELCLQPRF